MHSIAEHGITLIGVTDVKVNVNNIDKVARILPG